MPPEKDPTLKLVNFRLSESDRNRLDKLAVEALRRSTRPPRYGGSRTLAVRWALRFLEEHLDSGAEVAPPSDATG